MEANGEATLRVTPRRPELQFAPVLGAVLHCHGKMTSQDEVIGEFRCSNKLRRDGLALEAVVDLAPIVQKLAPADEIELWLEYPRLGFESLSTPLADQGGRLRVTRTARFAASAAPGPIRIQFGYRSDQLALIYLPLVGMALALTLIAMSLSRAGLAEMNRSVFLLGTILWLAAASRLQAADPLRILLSGTPLAELTGALAQYCPPLFCIAAGTALGGRNRTDRTPTETFADFFWSFGMLLFPLSCALAAVPAMADGNWIGAAPLLLLVTVSILVCRWRMRANAGSTSVRQLSSGELKERVAEMAARAGRKDVRVHISSSTRSRALNAFAMRRSGILLTAPLVQTLTKREVDAVAAHELSHFGQMPRSPWAALAIAAVLFQTPVAEILLSEAAGLAVAVGLPLIVFFAALKGARKREFQADAGAVRLTGDLRAMIAALARIARANKRPFEYNAVVEWFSTHPSMRKRIRALAAAGGLAAADVETLSSTDLPGEFYTLPPEEGSAIFTLAWQQANARRYVWTVLLGTSGAGLLVAWLLDEFVGAGVLQLVGGIALGCAITKVLSTAVMTSNYARLRRKLVRKLGVSGQLVGLAVDSEPRLYNGYRFSDAGLLWFEAGRLCYRSERTTIALNPSDVVDVSMVAAAPSSWRRLQPMVRFRDGEGRVQSFILHPVEWGATPRRLLQSIERWRTTATSAESMSVSGFESIAGEPFHTPTMAQTARGFRIPGGVTLLGSMFTGWFLRSEFWPAWYALMITAGAYIFMYWPALRYRPSARPPVLTPRVDGDGAESRL